MAEKINGYRADMAGLGDEPDALAVHDLVSPVLSLYEHPELRATSLTRPLMYETKYTSDIYDVTAALVATHQSNQPNIEIALRKPIDYEAGAPIHEFSYVFVATWGFKRTVYKPLDSIERFYDPRNNRNITYASDQSFKDRRQKQKGHNLARKLGVSVFTNDDLALVAVAMRSFNIDELTNQRGRQSAKEETE